MRVLTVILFALLATALVACDGPGVDAGSGMRGDAGGCLPNGFGTGG